MPIRPRFIGLLLVLLLLGSCKSTTYDLRDLEVPVVLNSNPFVGRTAASAAGRELSRYSARCEQFLVSGSHSSTARHQNTAQSSAFEAIGGYDNRAITDVELELSYLFVNALVALGDQSEIVATGRVMEYPSR